MKYNDNRTENQHLFQGKRIIPMVALPDDTIIMGCFTSAFDSNLWMGIDYANDEEVLQVEKLQTNSELYFFKMLLKMDVNIVRRQKLQHTFLSNIAKYQPTRRCNSRLVLKLLLSGRTSKKELEEQTLTEESKAMEEQSEKERAAEVGDEQMMVEEEFQLMLMNFLNFILNMRKYILQSKVLFIQ